ncbi:MAG: helix-turn-helix domain-containing protein, partial [Rhodococcus sp.]|nr:helix-turn-helix domain-containing protein [Rhodococcus sp. (in: high G+C Gram-positive bacteria)]
RPRTATAGDFLGNLTPTGFTPLSSLESRPDPAWRRAEIITSVWGSPWFGDQHIVDVHVRALRRKLGDDATDPRFIRTVRGVGYSLRSS